MSLPWELEHCEESGWPTLPLSKLILYQEKPNLTKKKRLLLGKVI